MVTQGSLLATLEYHVGSVISKVSRNAINCSLHIFNKAQLQNVAINETLEVKKEVQTRRTLAKKKKKVKKKG